MKASRESQMLLSIKLIFMRSIFFFFQAEDCIRDICVTGVQTCALPISGTLDDGLRYGHALPEGGGSSGEGHGCLRGRERGAHGLRAPTRPPDGGGGGGADRR